ncbi:hypothetical protein NDR87_18805 [Nocardia sp. CDC159]|uniref:Uncharacterized protein n=1 Tax=Nocardia pulmonis TaxID=2951408 RepID=A0A9X2IZ08_9NOCA|nr:MULTISPECIES: hypothetical protein [Nocardia]MCM6776259.1 hypothetical protein [Nocardia pulmonis]MCM6788415.1 hypothetical protein [Nocardia sp. CDC159]
MMHGIAHEPAPTQLSVAHHAIAGEVLAELNRAIAKFPPMNSMHEGWAILREEVDEMWDDIKANRWPEAAQEARQVAAMAIRFIHDMEQLRKRGAE